MKYTVTFLVTLFSFCTLYAQNNSKLIPKYEYSWDGKPGTESFQALLTNAVELNHFIPVWTGYGLDQMNINVVLATLDGVNLEPGDEIALFDGNLCVGMGKLSVIIDSQHMLPIKASRDDGSGNGYTPGHSIIYKFWDKSTGKEITIITATYYNNNPTWSVSGKYEADATAFVEFVGKTYVTQTISLKSGWNIFSVFVTPDNKDMKNIFQSHIANGSLLKVQDKMGNSLEDYGIFGGWTNNIGNIALTDGYKVKTTRECQLVLQGIPATFPFNIPLKAGWNIIGYPKQTETNGLILVQPLITRKTLVKVQDETGKSIEDLGVFGGWTNNIGNFKPGEGYKVKVTSDETLIISDSNLLQVPSVITAVPDSVTNSSVFLGGEVTSDGGAAVTERGVCFGTTQTPTTTGSKEIMGSGTGTFKGKITGLTANATYYARAYAINSQGTAYGGQVKFTTKYENCNPFLINNCDFNYMETDSSWVKSGVKTGDWYGNPTVSSWRSEITSYWGQWYDAWVEQTISIPNDAEYIVINACRNCYYGNDQYNSRISVLLDGNYIADHATPPAGNNTMQFQIPTQYRGQAVLLRIQIEGDMNTYAGLVVNWVGIYPDTSTSHF